MFMSKHDIKYYKYNIILIQHIARPEKQDFFSYKCKNIKMLNPMFLPYQNEIHQYY